MAFGSLSKKMNIKQFIENHAGKSIRLNLKVLHSEFDLVLVREGEIRRDGKTAVDSVECKITNSIRGIRLDLIEVALLGTDHINYKRLVYPFDIDLEWAKITDEKIYNDLFL